MADLSYFLSLIEVYPRASIIVLSFLVTLFITVVTYLVTDRAKMKEIRERQKKLQAEMKVHKNNPEKMLELQKELMKDLPEQMKHSFKPMLITMIPILIVFSWLNKTFKASTLGGWWIAYYIVSSLIFSIILRKIFKLQ